MTFMSSRSATPRTRGTWVVALIAVLGLLAAACGTTDEATSDEEEGPIHIGAVGPLSGLYSIVGKSQEAGIELAIEELGEDGINGRQVVLHSMDDEVEVDRGVTALRQLLDEREVVAVFGSTVTAVTEAMARVIEGMDEPIPQVGVVGSDDVIFPDGPGTTPREWIYGVLTGNHAGVATLANYIAENHPDERVAIFHDETIYGTGGSRLAVELLGEQGIEPVATIELPQNTTDPSPQVSRAMNADPDVFLMITSQDDAARVALAVEGQGIQLVCMDTCAAIPSYRELAGKAADGTVAWMLAASVSPTPAVEEFGERYQEHTGEEMFPPPDWAMQSYDMARILFQVFADVGTDPAAVKAALEEVKNFEGVSASNLSFGPDQHNALSDLDDYALVRIENGEIVPMEE